MAINEITTAKLKTFVILGHSNADGQAPYESLISQFSSYNPRADAMADPENSYWENVYVLTSAQPFPEVNGTPIASSIADVAWLELTTANPETPNAPHPHPSPWNYPNNTGTCLPRWMYCAWDDFSPNWASGVLGKGLDSLPSPGDIPQGEYFNRFVGVKSGVEIPLSYYWKQYWGDQVGIVKVAQGSTRMMPIEEGPPSYTWFDLFRYGSSFTPNAPGYIRSACRSIDLSGKTYDTYGYWNPSTQFDFAPSTNRFYQMWKNKMRAGAAALPSSVKMDVQMVVVWMGDNDSKNREQSVLEGGWETAVKTLVKTIRRDLVANGWTTLPEDQIPIIWPLVYTAYEGPEASPNWSSVDFCNGVLQAMEDNDPFFKTIQTSDLPTMEDEGENWWGNILAGNNAAHMSSRAYHLASTRIMAAFESTQTDPFDALDLDSTITVQQAIDRVRTYYGRSRANTDTDQTQIIQHLNAAYYHCINHCGDNTWWLRRRETMTLTTGPTSITTMPAYVHRLLRVENPSDPTYPIQFTQIGFGEGGKLQINVSERFSGTFVIHFITMPKRLVTVDQKLIAPENVTEWIIVEACSRIAASSGNAALMGHFAGQAQQLMMDTIRNMAQMQRSKNDKMRTQRRPVRFGYKHSYFNGSWASDSSV